VLDPQEVRFRVNFWSISAKVSSRTCRYIEWQGPNLVGLPLR
jgi:hypothetical protein